MARIADLLKALVKHGLKLSPKKCQFFRTELVYMGNVFKVEKGKFVDHPNQNQSGSYSEYPSSTHSKGMQKLLWSCKLFESLLSKFTEAPSSNL